MLATGAQLQGNVASDTPGRLRVRIHDPQRHPQQLQHLQQRLQSRPGVSHVDVNTRTGSLLVHYDRHQSGAHADLRSTLEDAGVLFQEVTKGLGVDEPELGGHSQAGESIVTTVTQLDHQLSALTGRKVDLKLLFPLTLGGVGVFQAFRAGLGFESVPAYVLLWYAFDSFWKFHSTAGPTPQDEQAAEQGRTQATATRPRNQRVAESAASPSA